jgi:hypothetical protein
MSSYDELVARFGGDVAHLPARVLDLLAQAFRRGLLP